MVSRSLLSTLKRVGGRSIIYLILTLWGIIILLPMYWMFTSAVKPESLLMKVPPEWIPSNPTLAHFRSLFRTAPALRWLLNSIIVSGVVTVASVIFDSMAGYVFAIKKPWGSNFFFILILGCLMVPPQIRAVPLFILISDLGWYNTYAALIIPFAGSAFGMFLMRQYMSSIPLELIDAGLIDGCGEIDIFGRIILPLSKPVLATLGIFIFVGTWNTMFYPLILTSSESMRTLPVGLSTLQTQYVVNYGIMMAGASVAAIPVIILFLSLQKYFTKGITVGAVKG